MGIGLIVEVFDYAPEDLTSAERLVLLALAEKANDTTRQVWAPKDGPAPRDTLQRRAGLSPSGLTKALRRLADRGLDVRVPVALNKHGKPVFAHESRGSSYRLPVLRADLLGNPLSDERVDQEAGTAYPEPALEGSLPDPRGQALDAESLPSRAGQVPQSLKSPSDARGNLITAGAAQVTRILGDCDDAHIIAEKVLDARHPDDLARYISSFNAKDLERFRKPARPKSADRCEHGTAGGQRIIAADGTRNCPKCDAEAEAVRQAVAS